jgi:hypothetical protein
MCYNGAWIRPADGTCQAALVNFVTEEDAMSKAVLLSGVVLIAALAAGAPAPAQAPESATPNLASADFGWQHGLGFTFRPVEGKVAPTKRGADLPGVERLADDRNPNLTPWAAAQIRMHNDLVKNGHRAFSAQSRCWPGGTPGQLAFLQPVYFIQTPNEVLMIWERDHQVRRVYLNREHSRNPKPSWFGESVGHYENGEHVIDTIGFIEHAYSFVDNNTTPHTKDLHVVERWKLTDGGNGLEATVTVDDPGAFKAPWTGMARLQKMNRPIVEWACAENNLGYKEFFELQEYPMPVANTPDF